MISYVIFRHTDHRVLGYSRLTYVLARSSHIFDSLTGKKYFLRVQLSALRCACLLALPASAATTGATARHWAAVHTDAVAAGPICVHNTV